MRRYQKLIFVCLLVVLTGGCSGGGGNGGNDASNGDNTPPPIDPGASSASVVLAFNDLGMHCMDREFSIFSILPPFNVVNAQVILKDAGGQPYLSGSSPVTLTYDAVADPSGSVNSYSVGKTNFWQFLDMLYGTGPQNGEGLAGLYMPDDNPQNPGPQPVAWNPEMGWFTARGIPKTPLDDSFQTNPFSLLRFTATDITSGQAIGYLDTVVPVAAETDCRDCHKTGAIAASAANITWSDSSDIEVQSKINILRLHDAEIGTALDASRPVLCARCHYSAALDLSGTGPSGEQAGNPNFSRVMHNFHAKTGAFPPDGTVEQTCYQCHPGKITQCFRGAMKTGNMVCKDCHGDMLAVGAQYNLLPGGSIDGTNDGNPRRPWIDLPRCQACHSGDALNHLTGNGLVSGSSGIRLIQAWRTGDPSASPLLAANDRFAENPHTLYRNSKGHGGIGCEGCHGSPHAVWPNAQPDANDNIAAVSIQGHAGKIIECDACHAPGSLSLTTDGPHGLHNVNDRRWVDENHGGFYKRNPDNCRACHGADLTGTVLAKAAAGRSFSVEEGTVGLTMGQPVGCNRCHDIPGNGGGD